LFKGKFLAGAALATTAAALCGAPAAHAANRHAVAAYSAKLTKGAADHGAVPKSRALSLHVLLAPKGGEGALKAAVAAVSDPSSASYGHYLTPAQFRARFEPTAATVASVEHFLKAAGLKISGVEAHSRYVEATGTAAQAEAAFATGLHDYSRAGHTFQATTGSATVPSSLASDVVGVTGLSTAARVMKPTSQYPAAFVNARPCSQAYGQDPAAFEADGTTPLPPFQGRTLPYAPCGYTGKQFRTAYEGATALNGTGQTVAIVDAYAAPTILKDANTYATNHGDQPFAPGQFSQVNANGAGQKDKKLCGPTGWYGEETLDVEAVHGMAQGANVIFYSGKSCEDADLNAALANVVDDNKASIVTNSYGEPEMDEPASDIAADEQIFQQGALQGITFMFSSGDSGDELANTGTKQTDYPAADPYITAVGGTTTGIAPGGALGFQTGWGTVKYTLTNNAWKSTGFLYGSGGGVSSLFPEPTWQQGVVPAGTTGRAVPDVAMDADPTTGMLVGETQAFPGGPAYGEYRIGGTSLASPLMAGFQALASQRAGKRQGYLDPSLYAAAKSTPTDFLDVAAPGPDAGNVRPDFANGVDASGGILYSVRTFDQDSSLGNNGAVTSGWDSITGIGVPSKQYLTQFNSTGH
jgi:subtilase family serine protease